MPTQISYSRIDTNNISGSNSYTAWSIANKNFYNLYNAVNEQFVDIEPVDYSQSLAVSQSLTIFGPNDQIGWELIQLNLTGSSGSYSGSGCNDSNGTYTLDQNPTSSTFGLLVNQCGFIFSPGGGNTGSNFLNQLTGSFQPDTLIYMANAGMTNPNSYSVFLYLDTLVNELKTQSLWDKAYAIYPYGSDTADGNSFNLKDSGSTYRISWQGPWISTNNAHGPFGVYNNNGTWNSPLEGNFGDTTFNPQNVSLTDISICMWMQQFSLASGTPMGNDNLMFDVIGSNLRLLVNSNNLNANTFPLSTARGTYIATRSGSSIDMWVKPPTQSPVTFTGSVVSSTASLYVCSAHIGGLGANISGTFGFNWIGKGLTPDEMNKLGTIVENWCSWRPLSQFTASHNGLPGLQAPTTMSNQDQLSQSIEVLWMPAPGGCGWVMVAYSPDCNFGGPCFGAGNSVIMCSGSHNWYVVPTNTTQSICGFCNTH